MSVITAFSALCQLALLPLILAPVSSLQPYGFTKVLWMPRMLLPQVRCAGSFRYQTSFFTWAPLAVWLILCHGSCPVYIVGYL